MSFTTKIHFVSFQLSLNVSTSFILAKIRLHFRGISVLNNKTELEKAFAKHKKNLDEKQKEQERTEKGLGTEFNKILADRAKRLERLEKVVLSSFYMKGDSFVTFAYFAE